MLTKFGIPVSTTVFSVGVKGDSDIDSVLMKSGMGLLGGMAVGLLWAAPHLKKLPKAMKNFPSGFKRDEHKIKSLAEIKAEDQPVFEATHQETCRDQIKKIYNKCKDYNQDRPPVKTLFYDAVKSSPKHLKSGLVRRKNFLKMTFNATSNDVKSFANDLVDTVKNRPDTKDVWEAYKNTLHDFAEDYRQSSGFKQKSKFAMRKLRDNTYDSKTFLKMVQTCTTMGVFYKWLQHDFVNVMLFTPKQYEELAVGLSGLSIADLFRRRGGAIQDFTDDLMFSDEDLALAKTDPEAFEKKVLREAIKIDVAYMSALAYFKDMNALPMSTTWIYSGLQMGRAFAREGTKSLRDITKGGKKLLIGAGVAVGLSETYDYI